CAFESNQDKVKNFSLRPLSAVLPSWPHAGAIFGSELAGEPPLQRVDELAQVRAGLARIDQILDREGLGGAEGRGELLQFGLDLAFPGNRVWRAFDFAAVRRLHPAFNRQRTPFTRGPGNL